MLFTCMPVLRVWNTHGSKNLNNNHSNNLNYFQNYSLDFSQNKNSSTQNNDQHLKCNPVLTKTPEFNTRIKGTAGKNVFQSCNCSKESSPFEGKFCESRDKTLNGYNIDRQATNNAMKAPNGGKSTGRHSHCYAEVHIPSDQSKGLRPEKDSQQRQKSHNKVEVNGNNGSVPHKTFTINLKPGQYRVNLHLRSHSKPFHITLNTNKFKREERGTPPEEQQPLFYTAPSATTSSPTCLPRRIVHKIIRPSAPNGTHSRDSPKIANFEEFQTGTFQPLVNGIKIERKVLPRHTQNEARHRQRKGKYRLAERKKAEGNESYKNKEYRDAIKLYSEAIELCPDCAAYYSNRSACHMMLNKYAQALADAREAVRLDSSFVKGYIRVAKCNVALGDANAALSILRQASELDANNKAVRDEAENAQALIKCVEEVEKATSRKDFRMAIFHLDRALTLAAGCRSLKITKAEYLVYLQRYSDAQEIVNEILQFDNSNVDAIYVRGMCLYYQDNHDAAFTHFQHVLKLAPDHKKAKDVYKKAKLLKQKKEEGNLAFNKGQLKEALNIYSEALAIDPNNHATNSKLYCNRATVKAKLGNLDEAADDCTAAINLNEGYVKAYLRRAKCYQDLEKHDEAIRDYEKVFKLDRNQEHKRLLNDAKLQLKKSKRKDYYKILGVSKTASEDEIKKSYRKMALQHHPDRHANASDKEKQEHEIKFKEIGEAYTVLTDAKKKSLYDRGQDINDLDGGFAHDDVDPNQIFQAFFSQGGSNQFGFGHPGFGGFQNAGFSGGNFPGGFHFQFG